MQGLRLALQTALSCSSSFDNLVAEYDEMFRLSTSYLKVKERIEKIKILKKAAPNLYKCVVHIINKGHDDCLSSLVDISDKWKLCNDKWEQVQSLIPEDLQYTAAISVLLEDTKEFSLDDAITYYRATIDRMNNKALAEQKAQSVALLNERKRVHEIFRTSGFLS